MSIKFRVYNHPDDYHLVDNFLLKHYQPGNRDGNWIEPAWEYMHAHPLLDQSSLGKFGIWQEDGEIVSVVHIESSFGEAFFQFHPGYRYLRQVMLDYAEENLPGRSVIDGRKYLRVYINNTDQEFLALARGRGYERMLTATARWRNT